jgi:UDP-N-acetylglucosamine 1-carboxyvinyltransferase
MSQILVRPGARLSGDVPVSGAKNSVLKLMAACLLAPGRYGLSNVPAISDVSVMAELLEAMGCRVDVGGGSATLDVPEDCDPEPPLELVERMRASIAVLGPSLARFGRARVRLPGGDDLGPRPINLHLAGLEQLGASFDTDGGVIEARCGQLRGADVLLEYPSVGATENLLMAAVLAKGRTVIDNAAREPELVDLCEFLVSMGAAISGIGTSTLVVEGVRELHPASHRVVGDRIEAATYLAALGVAGGEITLRGVRADHMEMLLRKLGQAGMQTSPVADGVWAEASQQLRAVDIATLPYPGVATDYKPFLLTMLTVADGVSFISENVYGSGRFRYVDELRKMGADIDVESHHAVVRGVPRLRGAVVVGHDIRAAAALVVAGLAAEGETVVEEASHVDRGYEDLVGRLAAAGADVSRR